MEITIKGITYSYKYGTEGLLNYEEANGSMLVNNLKELSILMLSMILTYNKDIDITSDDFYNALEENPGALIEFQEAHTVYTSRQNALLEKYFEGKKKVAEESSH